MDLDIKKLTQQERYEPMGKIVEEIKLRKYSTGTFEIRLFHKIAIIKKMKNFKINGLY